MGLFLSKNVACRNGICGVIRSAQIADAENALELLDDVLKDGEGQVIEYGERRMSVQEERDWIEGFLTGSNDVLLVAEFDSRIVGILDFKTLKRKRLMHLGSMGIGLHPEWRGLGIGSMLMSSLLEWASTRPVIEKISLRVLANNERAIAMYKKFGFVEEGRGVKEIRFGPGSYVDDVLMACFVNS